FTILYSITAPFTSSIYTPSLHDALPISHVLSWFADRRDSGHPPRWDTSICCIGGQGQARRIRPTPSESIGHPRQRPLRRGWIRTDRKSTRLNSSHVAISYAVFCLKKKKL